MLVNKRSVMAISAFTLLQLHMLKGNVVPANPREATNPKSQTEQQHDAYSPSSTKQRHRRPRELPDGMSMGTGWNLRADRHVERW